MQSRLLRIFVLGFTCLWYAMLVPVHQRGQIKLPGVASADASGDRCCKKSAKPHAAPSCHGEPIKAGEPVQDAGSGCAVCHFIAGLHTPPPIAFVENHLGLLLIAPLERRAVGVARHVALPFHGLDPPLV